MEAISELPEAFANWRVILLSTDEAGTPSLRMFPFAYWGEISPGPSASLVDPFPPEEFSLPDGSVKFEETNLIQQKGQKIARNNTAEWLYLLIDANQQ